MLRTVLVILFIGCQSAQNVSESESFSFKEISENSKEKIIQPEFFTSTDNTKIAYYKYKSKKSRANLIFIHGGGAHSGAGYQILAKKISENGNTSVVLMDLRGHGLSEGARGDSPSPEQMYQDVKTLIELIKSTDSQPVYLGGHSSGGGLVLNYSSWDKKSDPDGYIFVSPELGYKSGTAREDMKEPFAKPRLWVFILSAFSGGNLFGNTAAVYLNYPKEVLKKDPLLITSLTRNTAVALTPDNPPEQFRKLNRRTGLFVGEKDELFVPEKVTAYLILLNKSSEEKSKSAIIKNENHLSIISGIDKAAVSLFNEWVAGKR